MLAFIVLHLINFALIGISSEYLPVFRELTAGASQYKDIMNYILEHLLGNEKHLAYFG